MSSSISRGQNPGIGTTLETFENDIFWPGREGETNAWYRQYLISADAVDVGNTLDTTTLRPGLVMAFDPDNAGNAVEYHATNAPDIIGVLDLPVRMVGDVGTTTIAKRAQIMVSGGIKAGSIKLVTNDEFALAALKGLGFRIDTDNDPSSAGSIALTDIGNATLTADSPYGIHATTTGVITLPALDGTKAFEIIGGAAGVVITSAAGNDIVASSDLAASTVTIGVGVQVRLTPITFSGTSMWRCEELAGIPTYA